MARKKKPEAAPAPKPAETEEGIGNPPDPGSAPEGDESLEAEMHRRITIAIAEMEAEERAEAIRQGLLRRARAGLPPGAPPGQGRSRKRRRD